MEIKITIRSSGNTPELHIVRDLKLLGSGIEDITVEEIADDAHTSRNTAIELLFLSLTLNAGYAAVYALRRFAARRQAQIQIECDGRLIVDVATVSEEEIAALLSALRD